MSKAHDKFTKIKLYPETSKVLRNRLKKYKTPPSLVSLANAAIVKGIKFT